MGKAQTHIIKRQVLEVELPSQSAAHELQNRISEVYKREITRALTDLFDRIGSPDENIVIDRLNVDLGRVNYKNLESEFPEKVRKKVEEALNTLISQAKVSGDTERNETAPGKGTLKDFLRMKYTEPGGGSSVEIRSANVSDLDRLVYFLKTGTVPWWVNQQSVSSISEVAQQLLRNNPEQVSRCIVPLLESSKMRKRFVYQFGELLIDDLMALVVPGYNDFVDSVSGDFEALNQSKKFTTAPRKKVRQLIRQQAFDFLYSQLPHIQGIAVKSLLARTERGTGRGSFVITKPARQAFLAALLQEFSTKLPAHTHTIGQKDRARTLMQRAASSSDKFLIALAISLDEVVASSPRFAKTEGFVEALTKSIIETPSVQLDLKKQLTEPLATLKEQDSVQDEVPVADAMVQNAGLVLLWPYLNPFFKELGLVQEGDFVTDDARDRAVHLLQYMVTLEEEHPEEELMLNKLLCGMEVTDPVSLSAALTKSEKEECGNLLKAVVTNWTALKSTSAESFRQSFLNKDGALFFEHEKWTLKVERTGADILLDTLPWGLSMIMLPWNRETLYTEW